MGMYRGGRCELRKRKREVSRMMQNMIARKLPPKHAAKFAANYVATATYFRFSAGSQERLRKFRAEIDRIAKQVT